MLPRLQALQFGFGVLLGHWYHPFLVHNVLQEPIIVNAFYAKSPNIGALHKEKLFVLVLPLKMRLASCISIWRAV